MKKTILKFLGLVNLFLASSTSVYSFCGFYVAKADAKLFNKSSSVILVRDQDRTVITMSSDFEGDVKDFAMVVPVPEVIAQEDVRVADATIFSMLDAYSSPRLVEYYDYNPCYNYDMDLEEVESIRTKNEEFKSISADAQKTNDYKVTIKAKYTVGEYDIIILSAEESNGLKRWLTDNDYKIPEKAEEVLEPYIKSDMSFFVVKVNLEKHEKSGYQELRPLQISTHSNRFMLPIRLGMANANGTQDLIIYSFTKKGKIECANYRTVDIPTNKNVPIPVKNEFGNFYKDLFTTAWKKEGMDALFTEYAWDLSSSNFTKCDPCSSTPPNYKDLREAGVYWLTSQQNNWGGSNYKGDVFFTRLHVRYDRSHFPQDLTFKLTPDKESFQGRYILQHPVTEDLDCPEAQTYYKGVLQRRQEEVNELASLTGWNRSKYSNYISEYAQKIRGNSNGWFEPEENTIPFLIDSTNNHKPNKNMVILLGIIGVLLVNATVFFVYFSVKRMS